MSPRTIATMVGFGWLGIVLLLPTLAEWKLSLFVTLLILEVSFVWSVIALLTRGRLLIGLGMMQIALFLVVPMQIAHSLGSQHYQFEGTPHFSSWLVFELSHVFRAADLLDTLEEFGLHLQPIRPKSTFAGMMLVGLHLIVDLLVLGAIVNWIRRSWGRSAKRFRLPTALLRIGPGAALTLCFGVVMYLAWKRNWSDEDVILWPIDQFLRLTDIGDAMNIFHLRLHSVEPTWGLSTLAIVFRLCCGLVLARAVFLLRARWLGGFGWTIEEQIELLGDAEEGTVEADARLAVIARLAKLPAEEVVPLIMPAMMNPAMRSGASEVLHRIGHRLRPMIGEIRELLHSVEAMERESAVIALEAASSSASEVVPTLIPCARANAELRFRLMKLVDSLDPHWPSNSSSRVLIDEWGPGLLNLPMIQQREYVRWFDAINPHWVHLPFAGRLIQQLRERFVEVEHRIAVVEQLRFFREQASGAMPLLVRALGETWIEPGTLIATLDVIDPPWRTHPPVIAMLSKLREKATQNARTIVQSRAAKILDGVEPGWARNVDASAWIGGLKVGVSHSNPDIRSLALKAVHKLGPAAIEVVPSLIEVLKSTWDVVRVQRAVEALVAIGPGIGADAVEHLAVLLWRQPNVRFMVLDALAELGAAAKPAISAMMTTFYHRDETAEFRIRVLQTLMKIAPDDLQTHQRLAMERSHPDWQVREAVRLLCVEHNVEEYSSIESEGRMLSRTLRRAAT